jgi:hypothetical protein
MRRCSRLAAALCIVALLSPGPTPAPARAAEPAPDTSSTAARETQVLRSEAGDPLVEPAGVLGDAFGRVWVSDASLHKLRRWDASGAALDETGALGSEPGRFRRPGGLARLGSLGVAVLDVENQRVVSYDHHLRLLGVLVDLASADLERRVGRVRPVALAADRGGAVYVADADRDRVLVFDFAGSFLRELGGFAPRAGGFAGLSGIACSPRGALVTVERPRAPSRARRGAGSVAAADSLRGRSRVQWLDAGGRVTRSLWLPAWTVTGGEVQVSVAVDDSDRVAVAGERSGELFLIGAEGGVLGRLAGLASPRALGFAPDGSLLVAEAGAGRVRRFTPSSIARE